jgi:ABC-type transport system involved in multi-copper enzyme maturation permease subunit
MKLNSRFRDWSRVVVLSARLIAGRKYWLAPALVLIWPVIQIFVLVFRLREESFEAVDAQNTLIGVPLVVLAVGLGVRIIAGEMDRRTLEIAYTVPGGAHRVWVGKIAAAVGLLLVAEVLLAVASWVIFTSFPLVALYGALQAAAFYLAAAMAFAALSRSEITGAMATAALLGANGFITAFGERQVRVSPFFNPLAIEDASASDLFAWTIQNRIGFVLAIAAVTALAFSRAERREKLL